MLRKKSREKKNFNLFIQGFCGKNVFLRLEILFAGLWTASGWLRKKPLPSFSSYCRASFFLKWLDEIKGGRSGLTCPICKMIFAVQFFAGDLPLEACIFCPARG